MKKCALMIFSFLLLAGCAEADLSTQSNDKAQAITSVSYCEILKAPQSYRGRLVRVSAVWKFGFETSSLYDQKCAELSKTWLEFADEKELCPETEKNRKVPIRGDKEANVTVTGKLYGPGRYGHLGDYQFRFVVNCLEKIKVTASDSEIK